MNKLSIMAKGMIIAMGMVGIAHADNAWQGLYAGGEAGLALNHARLKSQHLGFTNPSDTCDTSADFATFYPGIQFGYMHQFLNSFVAGIEANATVNTNQKATLSCNSKINANVYDRFAFKSQVQTAIKGRVGKVPNWHEGTILPYLTAGVSVDNVGLTYKNEARDYYATSATRAGLLIGAGIEWAFKQSWSFRAEYYYVDYGSIVKLDVPVVYGLLDPSGHGHVYLRSNNVALSFNYWL